MNARRSFPSPEPSPNSSSSDPLAMLTQAVGCDEAALDLGRAALAIAAAHYVDFDMAGYLARLDALAKEARQRIGRTRRPLRVVSALNAFLFDELGFHGNREDYYNPANSFLNEVLDRRTGLPITLSVLYLALAHRLRLPLYGVGMPLHFIVKYIAPGQEIFIDPFYGGEMLTPEDCRARIEQIAGQPIVFDPACLNATPKRRILYRLLNNLKQIYLRREEPGRAGRVVEQMLIVAPDSHADVRDRGLLFLQENALSRGVEWLTRYLERAPEAPDAAWVRSAINHAWMRHVRQN
ncbi:MAG TPA: transglutaminase-like domain-containing protein [Chthonomonadaceae bacterium]|nr:transglutaminase-like domain-containing protein [Chthonomonadaceae bacterium]